MGYPYNHFIPVLLLRNNPGVTFTEYAELLSTVVLSSSQLHLNSKDEYWMLKNGFHDPVGRHQNVVKEIRKRNLRRWDCSDQEVETSIFYHAGLHSVARQLHLPYTKSLLEWETKHRAIDYFGHRFGDRTLDIQVCKNRQMYYTVTQYEPCQVGGRIQWFKRFRLDRQTGKIARGVIIHHSYDGPIIIDKVIKDYRPQRNEATFIARELLYAQTRKGYTESEFLKAHPKLTVDNIYDFTQKSGILRADSLSFLWRQEGGKLYLHEPTFQQLFAKSSFPCNYTDYIVTEQAVTHKAWKMLGYSSGWMVENFYKKFPQAVTAHERAIWDQETSRHAVKEKLTHFDLLRFRLLAGVEATNASLSRRASELAPVPKQRRKAPGPTLPPEPIPEPEVPF